MPFNQGMTVPVDLSLRETADGPRLFAEPVPELRSLRADHHSRLATELWPGDNALAGLEADVFEIDATLDLEEGAVVTFTVGGAKVVANAADETLRCGSVEAPLTLDGDGRVRLQILVDRGSMEVFAGDGRVALAEGVLLPGGEKPLTLYGAGGKARLESFDLWTLRSIWAGL
jgi:fructan beta-fructosidase